MKERSVKIEKGVFRRLPVSQVRTGSRMGKLQRTLGALELTFMGIGAILGSGLFVITGVAAAEHAGPGLVLSFVIAGIACGCAALCYAELASFIPASGGAYTFVYAGLGEIFAWFIGWCLTLEYIVGISAIAVGWSAYASNVLPLLGIRLPWELLTDPSNGGIVNLPAIAIISAMALVQMKGAEESARVNNVLVTVKLMVVLIFIALLAGRIDPANYVPFLPFGWPGVFSGAAVVFFAYLGFDAIANSAEEVKDPQRNMPRGILASLVIATILYIAVTFILTGVNKYYAYAGMAAPMAFALSDAGIRWGSAFVSVGAVAGLMTGILVFIGSESRLIYSMARDGLLPKAFAQVSKRGVPGKAVACVWLLGSLLAGTLPIDAIAELCNMGTLWAFFLVSLTLMVLRRREPCRNRGFSVPFVPLVPLVAMMLCVWLAVQLSGVTWATFGSWTLAGMCIYAMYGAKRGSLV